MDKTKFDNIARYQAMMNMAKILLGRGLISAEEYAMIDTKIANRIGLNSCTIYRQNHWINGDFRGNMAHYKED